MDNASIYAAIKADPQNQAYTRRHIDPLYSVHDEAKIVIVGQAPGTKAEATKKFWNDPSGVRLREWMGVSDDTFYHDPRLAILPLDFYFPGRGKSGDLPPRKGFAAKWHPLLLENMPQVELFILVGSYAQKFYLKRDFKGSLTETTKEFETFLPRYFPLVHPSPRNQYWLQQHPWFQTEVVPALQKRVASLLTP